MPHASVSRPVSVGAVLLSCTLLGVPVGTRAADERCSVNAGSGVGLGSARALFAERCPTHALRDCDPVDGRWQCSSETIGAAPSGGRAAGGVPAAVPTAPSGPDASGAASGPGPEPETVPEPATIRFERGRAPDRSLTIFGRTGGARALAVGATLYPIGGTDYSITLDETALDALDPTGTRVSIVGTGTTVAREIVAEPSEAAREWVAYDGSPAISVDGTAHVQGGTLADGAETALTGEGSQIRLDWTGDATIAYVEVETTDGATRFIGFGDTPHDGYADPNGGFVHLDLDLSGGATVVVDLRAVLSATTGETVASYVALNVRGDARVDGVEIVSGLAPSAPVTSPAQAKAPDAPQVASPLTVTRQGADVLVEFALEEPVSARVEYGPSAAYGRTREPVQETIEYAAHRQDIAGYGGDAIHVRVTGVDGDGNRYALESGAVDVAASKASVLVAPSDSEAVDVAAIEAGDLDTALDSDAVDVVATETGDPGIASDPVNHSGRSGSSTRTMSGSATVQYAKRPVFNADETRVFLARSGKNILDLDGNVLRTVPVSQETFWHSSDPDLMIAVRGDKVVEYDVRTSAQRTLWHAPGTIDGLGNAEGAVALDRYGVYEVGDTIYSVDLSDGTVLGAIARPKHYDYYSFSKSGKYIVGRDGSNDRRRDVQRFNPDFSGKTRIHDHGQHADTIVDSAGDDWWVQVGYPHLAIRLRDGAKRDLYVEGHGHVSGRSNVPGRVLFSSTGSDGEMFEYSIEDEGASTLGWGSHDSSSRDYHAQAKASWSWSGRRAAYTSDKDGTLRAYVVTSPTSPTPRALAPVAAADSVVAADSVGEADSVGGADSVEAKPSSTTLSPFPTPVAGAPKLAAAEPDPLVGAASVASPIEAVPAIGRLREGDLLVLMHDDCPELDDGLVAAATKAVSATLGAPAPWIVDGACEADPERAFGRDGAASADATGGGTRLDADADPVGAVSASADAWAATLANGRDVWVTESGTSNVTAAILREMAFRYPSLDLGGVHVVQDSPWDEGRTAPENLAFVREVADYRRIGDPERSDSGAGAPELGDGDFRSAASRFADLAAGGPFADAWRAAFDYLPLECLDRGFECELDLRGAAGLLYILGDERVRDADRFVGRHPH